MAVRLLCTTAVVHLDGARYNVEGRDESKAHHPGAPPPVATPEVNGRVNGTTFRGFRSAGYTVVGEPDEPAGTKYSPPASPRCFQGTAPVCGENAPIHFRADCPPGR